MGNGSMKSKLFIKRMSDGAIRESKWQNGSEFWWTEGNAGCDCNRASAFGDEREDDPCGDSRYELVNEDGTPFDAWDDNEIY